MSSPKPCPTLKEKKKKEEGREKKKTSHHSGNSWKAWLNGALQCGRSQGTDLNTEGLLTQLLTLCKRDRRGWCGHLRKEVPNPTPSQRKNRKQLLFKTHRGAPGAPSTPAKATRPVPCLQVTLYYNRIKVYLARPLAYLSPHFGLLKASGSL